MHFEILVEDASGKIALESILGKILGTDEKYHPYRIVSYNGVGHIPKNLKGKDTKNSGSIIERQSKKRVRRTSSLLYGVR